jgi:FtsP/CotA-like multicopper oxidase with cupredoxin domain
LLLVIIMSAVVVVGVAGILLMQSPNSQPTGPLPSGCTKPAGGFLIIASKLGYNDSVDHGVPSKPWPVITVNQGQRVDITVCNTDIQAHGFQVAHYFDSTIESIAPGQAVHVSFVADQPGDFQIYCSIFCSVHAFMQSGQLRVLS